MSDNCRIIADNLGDQEAQVGALIVGSDAVDISSAGMTAGADGWQVLVKAASPAVQSPRLSTTVALYLDADGRAENNAVGGPRLGADTVYALVNQNGSWRVTKEVLNTKNNVFEVAPTTATYSITGEGYNLNIPFIEVGKSAPAYWKAGVAVQDTGRLSVDYAPNAGLSCAPALVAKDKVYISTDQLAQIAAGAIVIIIVAVLILKKIKNNKKYDNQKQPH